MSEIAREAHALRSELEQVKRERDLTTSQLLMVGSEISGDPKMDALDHRDPRWTPTLKEAAKLRADNKRLRTDLASAEEALRQVDAELTALAEENEKLRAELRRLLAERDDHGEAYREGGEAVVEFIASRLMRLYLGLTMTPADVDDIRAHAVALLDGAQGGDDA